ncbi:PAS domain-containing sensor histidine kinase [Marinoscillum sp. MHG1-6]|uniref:PAS domain-containing sensor histidine kinase n=1 Tax=Marinoscillum sp. MHG1-6 TaxID=2959627 RepID=UPI0021574514|nr:PAS domain-containing sensor histidine kinase [Marinoscillum sp. MHG1-6]
MIASKARLYLITSYLTVFIGLLAVTGWFINNEYLIRIIPGLPTMKFNTALGFGLTGIMFLLNFQNRLRESDGIGIILLVLGVLSLLEQVTDYPIGLAELFMKDHLSSVGEKGLMSVATAGSFILLSISMSLSSSNIITKRIIGQFILHYVTLIAYLSLLGYVYGIANESRIGFIGTMSLPTTVLFLLLSVVATFKNPKLGITGLLGGPQPGNMVARQMFMVISISILIIGFLATKLVEHQDISAESAITLFGLLAFALYTGTITSLALRVNHIDKKRKDAEHALQEINRTLETKVDDRARAAKRALELLNETNRIAKIGGWEFDPISKKLSWTTITYQVHEVPLDFTPSIENAIQFYKDDTSREKITKAINNALSLGASYDLELQITTAKGNEKWVRATGAATFEGGKCSRINGTFQDITLRKTAELKLKDERAFLQSIIDHLPIHIYAKDSKDKITLINRNLLNFLDKPDETGVVGASESEVIPEELTNNQAQSNASVLKIYKHNNHSPLWFVGNKLPIKDVFGNNSGQLILNTDITERKETEEKLKHMAVLTAKSKEMEQFAYITSHDLKEPLLTMKNYISLLSEEYLGGLDEVGKRYLQTIEKGASRLEDLINALLDYSRLNRMGKLTSTNIMESLNDLTGSLEDLINKSKATIKYADLPIINCYPQLLSLLFQNLITNSIKFAKPDVPPEINITCQLDHQNKWVFSVADNGIGIPKKHFESIFIIFKRLNHRTKYPGTGIGLAHCQKIVELHGGKIWVDSKEGSGSIFHFTIPADL